MANERNKGLSTLNLRNVTPRVEVNQLNSKSDLLQKSHRLKFGTREKATEAGNIIHTDVCGPFAYTIFKFRHFVYG